MAPESYKRKLIAMGMDPSEIESYSKKEMEPINVYGDAPSSMAKKAAAKDSSISMDDYYKPAPGVDTEITMDEYYGSSGPSEASDAGKGIMGAGAMTGNPYVAAAGLGLQVLGASEERKRRQAEAKADANNKRVVAQQRALQGLMQLSQGLRL